MAKTFNDIVGVVALDEKGKECYHFSQNEKYKIISRGDIIFKLNLQNNTIEKKRVKYVRKWKRNTSLTFYICDANEKRDLIPVYGYYGNRSSNMMGNLEEISLMKTRNSGGLYFLKIEDATKRLNDIRNGKYFGSLSEGDVVYFCDKDKETISELKIIRVCLDATKDFYIEVEDKDHRGRIRMGNSFYEKNASYYTDFNFSTYLLIDSNPLKHSVHIDREDAEKTLKAYQKSLASSLKKKEKKKEENPIGTPIQFKDNKGHELKIGDSVAYVRKAWNGHTDISFAVIIGETPTKVKLFDEDEKQNERGYSSWKRCDGFHSVEKENLVYISSPN